MRGYAPQLTVLGVDEAYVDVTGSERLYGPPAGVALNVIEERASRAQVRTSSTGDTGLTMKSATRIWSSVRATFSSKLCVTTMTGGVSSGPEGSWTTG